MPGDNTHNNAVISLDLGTSSFKCGSFNSELDNIVTEVEDITLPQNNGKIIEFDFDEAFNAAMKVLTIVAAETQIQGYSPQAIVITSQAQTFAPVDADLNPLRKGISWLDRRAVEEALTLTAELPEFTATAGFAVPTPGLFVSKLLWLKNNSPAVYQKAQYFTLLNEYIAAKLTNTLFSDSTNFGMGGVYDISRRRFNNKALAILDLSPDRFPAVYPALGKNAPLTSEVSCQLDLPDGVSLYLAGNDQSSSAVGAGLEKKGDVTVNFGTALVFYTILDQPPERLEEHHVAGINPVNGKYFLLSVDNEFGSSIGQARKQFFPEGNYEDVYRSFRECERDSSFIPLTRPGDIFNDEFREISPARRAGSLVNYFLDRIREYLAGIGTFVQPQALFPSGGAAESDTFLSILQEKLSCPVFAPRHTRESGLRGAAELYYRKII